MPKIRMTWFDLSGSLKVKVNGTIWKEIPNFLFNFNSNDVPKVRRFEDIAL